MATSENDIVIRGPLHRDRSNVLCGPVSRFACRIICRRDPPYSATLYAAGFNSDNEIFLSESAPKICSKRSRVDDFDALTTFGVRVFLPDANAWREVSVHGNMHQLRPGLNVPGEAIRSQPKNAKVSCELVDGAIIDIAGIQLLWRTGAGRKRRSCALWSKATGAPSPQCCAALASIGPVIDRMLQSTVERDRIVERIHTRRPQCPVQYHTINFKYCLYSQEEKEACEAERRPYVRDPPTAEAGRQACARAARR